MRVAIIGSHGMPANYGGYETFAQELSVRLVKMGMQVVVYCDYSENRSGFYEGVILKYISCTKTSNPLKYYHNSVRLAEKDSDIVLICGAAGALFIYSKLFHRNVCYLTNMDGIEYLRTKWSLPKRVFVRFCIWTSVYLSDYVIADSKSIREFLLKNYFIKDKRIIQIEYGADINEKPDLSILEEYNLKQNGYYLVVSRLEPENNVECIIRGYIKSEIQQPLIVVGNLLETKYVKALLQYRSEKIRFLGGVYDKSKLEALRYGCKAYLHGHSVGGTNPSLLEALGSANIIIAHDNVFNREVTDNKMFYFKTPEECSECFIKVEALNDDAITNYKKLAIRRIIDFYNWERVAQDYYNNLTNIYYNETISS
jgi:glycosyltransferase involved in cell wall biosynthesis